MVPPFARQSFTKSGSIGGMFTAYAMVVKNSRQSNVVGIVFFFMSVCGGVFAVLYTLNNVHI